MKRFLLTLIPSAALVLSACVDTTGLTGDIHTAPHPKTSPNAIAVVAEYGDLQCPACRAAHTTLTQPLIEKYGTQIRFEFHHFPLSSIHRYALEAAEGSECAADQGKFWEFLDLAYAHQQDLNSASIRDWATQLTLDTDLFGRCMDSHIKRDAILASYDEGKNLGVAGTPTYFVNGVQTSATMDALSAAIDKVLATAKNML